MISGSRREGWTVKVFSDRGEQNPEGLSILSACNVRSTQVEDFSYVSLCSGGLRKNSGSRSYFLSSS